MSDEQEPEQDGLTHQEESKDALISMGNKSRAAKPSEVENDSGSKPDGERS